MANKIFLIDGYGFVFRAFHSMPSLTRPSDGSPIGAVYGFTTMLLRLIENNRSSHFAVMLDSGGKTLRHSIDPNYKAHRPPIPPELILQFPIIRDVIKAFDIKPIEKEGYEADDLLASYAKHASENGYEVVIVSSDKDLMQLLEHDILMYDAMKDKMITNQEVFDKFGVLPKQLRDVLALIGDSSDNIPGVRGIGPKTAAELINEFGSLKGVYENISNIKQEKRRTMLIEDKPNALLSYELVGLRYDAPLDYNLDELAITQPNHAKIADFAISQGFKSLATKLNAKSYVVESVQSPSPQFIKLSSIKDLKINLDEIYKEGWLAFLINEHEIYLSFAKNNFVISLSESKLNSPLFAEIEGEHQITEFLNKFNEIFCSEAVTKITINSKWLYKHNPKFINIEDISIMGYAIETGRDTSTLEFLTKEYGMGLTNLDSYTIYKLYTLLHSKLITEKLTTLYQRVDRLLPKTIAIMEQKGVKINVDYLNELSHEFKAKLSKLESQIFKLAGTSFNIGSPKQLGEILFDHLKLPGGKKSKLGAYATGVKILQNLEEEGHEITSLILNWREYSKLISTYTEALPKSVNPQTKRIHSSFSITSTATGRFSSTEPNLQNIPIRTQEGQKIRKAFIASPGNKIISADYSQIELRLLAHYADITPLKNAFKMRHDIHAITATQIFNVTLDEVNNLLRRQAKTINFGIIYGISSFGLAKRLDISQKEAKIYIDKYFAQYPGIKDYMDKTIEFAKAHGYIYNIFGRKCMLPSINNSNYNLRGFAERAAINAPLQSSAADIIKKAMVLLPPHIAQYMILQVHDELLFEVPEDQVDQLSKTIKKIMESSIHISVPLIVDINSGNSWAEAH